MIKNRKLTAGKPHAAHHTNSRKHINADAGSKYAVMLQLYMITKNEKILRKRLKPVAKGFQNKKNKKGFASLKGNIIVNVFRPLFQKLSTVKSRIYSAIEISYQSFIG